MILWWGPYPTETIQKSQILDQLPPSCWKTIDENDLLVAIDQIENYLKSVDQNVDQFPIQKKKEASLNQPTPWNSFGAEGGTRTRTGLRLLDPEWRSTLIRGNSE